MQTAVRYILAGLILIFSIGFAIFKWITVDGGAAATIFFAGFFVAFVLIRPEDERRMERHEREREKRNS